MSKSYKMKNELRSASEVTLTNFMAGAGGGTDTPPGNSTTSLDVIGLTNLANSDLNLARKNKGTIIGNSAAHALFNNNNNHNHVHHPLHQLHHLHHHPHHHHLHRPYDRTASWTVSKYHSSAAFFYMQNNN